MSTFKTIIAKDISTVSTVAYTNATIGNAALKAINVSHIGDINRVVQTTTGSEGWSGLGNIPMFYGGSSLRLAGHAFPIQLTDDRLLLLIPPGGTLGVSQTNSGDVSPNELYAQIVELQSGNYVCGPITKLTLSANSTFSNGLFNTNNTVGLSGVALTPTTVAFAVTIGQAWLYSLTITGNIVSPVVRSYQFSANFASAINSAIAVNIVPGDTTKVVLTSRLTTNFAVAAYTISANSNPVLAGSVFDIGIAHGDYTKYDMSLHRRTDPTYMFAGFTSATAVTARIFTFVSSTNTWAAASPSASLTGGSKNSNYGIAVGCLSDTSAATYSSVIAILDNVNFCLHTFFQTSGTTVSGTGNFQSTYATMEFHVSRAVNVGPQKLVVVGTQLISGFINGSTSSTNLSVSPYLSNSNAGHVYPFVTRPLIYYNRDLASSQVGFQARAGSTATSWGSAANNGNYLPFGASLGRHYAWSETANAYVVGGGTSLFLVSAAGVVLAERNFSLNGTSIKCVSVLANGAVVFATDKIAASAQAIGALSIFNSWGDNATGEIYILSTATAVTSASFQTASWVSSSASNATSVFDLISWTAYDGVNRFSCLHGFNNDNTTHSMRLTTGVIGVAPTFGTSNLVSGPLTVFGLSGGLTFVQTSPLSAVNVNGLYAVLGWKTTDFSVGITTTPISPITAGYTPMTTISTTTTGGIPRPAVDRRAGGFSAIATYNTSSAIGIAFITSQTGIIGSHLTGISAATASTTFPLVAASKNHATVCWQGGDPISVTPILQQWTAGNVLTSTVTISGTAGSNVIRPSVANTFATGTFGSGLDNQSASFGSVATTFKCTIGLSNNDVLLTPQNGDNILIGSSNRSTETYYVPPGYNIKVTAGAPLQLDTVLTVLEEI